jgi:hypothetical protein
MKLTSKKKYYALLAGVLIFYGLFGYFVFAPWSLTVSKYKLSSIISQIKEKSKSFTDLNNAYYLMTKKRDLLYDLESEYSSVGENLPMISGAILSKDKALDFLVMIEGLADKTGVRKDISIDNITKDDSLNADVFPLSLKIYGFFPNVSNFIALLENSPWTIKLGRIEITRAEQQSGSRASSADVTAEGEVQAVIALRVLAK